MLEEALADSALPWTSLILLADLLGGLRRLAGKLLDLVGGDDEALCGLPGTHGLDRRVEGRGLVCSAGATTFVV